MTKPKLHADCSLSPTGSHERVMSWPEPGVYIGTCRWCGDEKQEDATLGMGRNVLPNGTTFFRGRTEFRLQARRASE